MTAKIICPLIEPDQLIKIEEATTDAVKRVYDRINDYFNGRHLRGKKLSQVYLAKSLIDASSSFDVTALRSWNTKALNVNIKYQIGKRHFKDGAIVVAVCTEESKDEIMRDLKKGLIERFRDDETVGYEGAHPGRPARDDHAASCIYFGYTFDGKHFI